MKNCGGAVILLSFPHQLIHALAALHTDRERRGINKDAPVLIFIWSYRWFDHRKNSSFLEIINKLSKIENCQLYIPSLLQRVFGLSEFRVLKQRVKYVNKIISLKDYDSFYYSHDFSADHTAQVFMQAFPNIYKVCFGDPPGFLYKNYTSIAECMENIKTGLKGIFWKSRLKNIEKWHGYDKAYVAMNLSTDVQSYPLLTTTIPNVNFINLLNRLKNNLPTLEQEEHAFIETLESFNQNKIFQLLVLSNFTESGLISRENELKLYLELCHRHCPPGSTIIIKPHILSNPAFLESLKSSLGKYQVILFPENLRCVPLEMLTELLSKCNIISVSSSSIFLSYLYGKERIVHALTLSDVRQFFNEESYAQMSEATQTIINTLKDFN
ncbi:TPA: hypothetical protein U6330_001115 [Legionella pneumophila]|nr:hypothetical protein [Legionella pneumophila]HEN5653548.1 hypothetical protein [Legionella pneumophila]HEN5663265.1 hypothetical protein [Legionella pneumophila]